MVEDGHCISQLIEHCPLGRFTDQSVRFEAKFDGNELAFYLEKRKTICQVK